MKRAVFQECAAVLSAALLVTPQSLSSTACSASVGNGVLATRVNLAVVTILAQDKNTGKPLEGLSAEDFEVFDNGESARISVFRHGSEPGVEPVTLWLVTECPQKDREENVSTSFSAGFLEPALKELNSQDKIGIAHWCRRKGESGIDLAATEGHRAAEAALNAVMKGMPRKSHKSSGVDALQEILSLIHRQTSSSGLDPRPVIVFLGSHGVGLLQEEAANLAKEVISHTSLTVYAINQRASRVVFSSASQLSPMVPFCEETGGQVLSTKRANWGDALGQIVNGFHSRYEIAFLPPTLDRGWHTVRIKLTDTAIRKHGPAILRYRSSYFGGGTPLRYSITEVSRGPDYSLDSSLSQAVKEAGGASEIAFDVEGATYEGPSKTAKLSLTLGDDGPLSWAPMPNRNHRSEITILIVFLSPQGEVIERKIKAYEIMRRPTDSWTLLNQRVIIDSFVEYPADADRVRFVIRDDATGRSGTQDVPMRRILDAPKLRAVIY